MSWTAILVILFLIFIASLSINAFLMWYSWKSIQQIRIYDEELTETINIIINFTNHLKSVYELEMFYGDETLRHLMRHAQDITEVFSQYDLYSEEEIAEEEGIINDDRRREEA